MKIEKLLILSILTTLVISLSGCQLAKDDITINDNDNMNEDIFMGLYISPNPLPLGTNDAKYYATEQDKEKYEFENYEGIPFYSISVLDEPDTTLEIVSAFNGSISDGRIDYKLGDDYRELILRGTLYVLPDDDVIYHINHIYRSQDNRVYLISGDALAFDSEDTNFEGGYEFSTNTESTIDGETSLVSISTYLNFWLTDQPIKVKIIQQDANHTTLISDTYAADEMPSQITTLKDCESLIVETHGEDKQGHVTINSEFYNKSDESITTLYNIKDTICTQHITDIIWK